MGIFDKKTDEERAAEKAAKHEREIAAVLEKYGLNLDAYDDASIRQKTIADIRRIASDLFGNGMIKMGMAFSFAKAEEQAKVSYLSALVQQNWILIRQNEQIIRLLSKREDVESAA